MSDMESIGVRGATIQEFYRGASVLITGETGFMGKVLVEKLLRSCPHLSSVYLLVRSKKGKDAESRLDDLFNDPVRKTFCALFLHMYKDKARPATHQILSYENLSIISRAHVLSQFFRV
ncbi:putative fatty acyl-CoA reductase CG5065 [Zootermopsis nevadensis]|nr:putative fatty acyl-CoA reductase CG5065 [Zootermopsis nevadensis]